MTSREKSFKGWSNPYQWCTLFLFSRLCLNGVSLSTPLSSHAVLPHNDGSIIGSAQQCIHFPEGLAPETRLDLPDLLRQWRNECPMRMAYTGVWIPDPKGTRRFKIGIPEDVKCCSTPVDYTLSAAIFDLHNFDKGTINVDRRWNVECPANHVVTAIQISENANNGYKGHVSGMKCAMLVNHVIDHASCRQLNLLSAYGGTRDSSKDWQGQCPTNTKLVGFYDDDGFNELKYGKCCGFKSYDILNKIPWSCSFDGGSTCEWQNTSDLKVKWKHGSHGSNNFLTIARGKTGGKARLLSPGLPAVEGPVCFRLLFFMTGSVAINVFRRAYIPEMKFTNTSLVKTISYPQWKISQKDILMRSETSFQIIVEGVRADGHDGMINLIEIGLVDSNSCKDDQCHPPNKGCKENEMCTVSQGYLQCLCKDGYSKVNGLCVGNKKPTPTGITEVTTTSSGNPGGRSGGGDGKTDGGGELGPDGRGGSAGGKKLTRTGEDRFGAWIYTTIGAIAGIFLVLVFVFGFMLYRRKTIDARSRYSFNYEMGHPRFLSFGSGNSEGNNNHTDTEIIGQTPTRNVYVETPPRVRIEPTWSSHVVVDDPIMSAPDTESSASGSPQSHHYHELEPDDDVFLRRVSQVTLIQPIYGSSEDLSEEASDGSKFFEPPSDEEELFNQLGREISYHSITLKEEIGHGAFGFVKLGYWDKHNSERVRVAVKMLKEPTTAEERVKFLQEAAIMRQFDHSNVVKMYGIVTRFCSPMIVLEYMSKGNLRRFLYKLRRSRERQNIRGVDYDLHRLFLRMAREITAGMCYLHSLSFVHRDLAARNILLDSDLVCKIGDFGLARDLIGCEYYKSGGGVIPVKWTAPEAINYKRYSSSSDIWSFGITLYEIWSLGVKPYFEWDNITVINKVNQGYRLPPPPGCPRVIYHLMIDCWHPEETKRPRFSQIKYCLSHHDDRLIGRFPRTDRIRSVTCNDIEDNKEQGLYDDLQYIYCKTE